MLVKLTSDQNFLSTKLDELKSAKKTWDQTSFAASSFAADDRWESVQFQSWMMDRSHFAEPTLAICYNNNNNNPINIICNTHEKKDRRVENQVSLIQSAGSLFNLNYLMKKREEKREKERERRWKN